MSKTYWLVSSNGVPKPGMKDNQLILGDVNAFSIRELKRSEKYKWIYYEKDTSDSLLNSTVTPNKSLKNRLNIIKNIPIQLKVAMLFLTSYFLSTLYFILNKNDEFSITLAFISIVSTLIICIFSALSADEIYGPMISLILGVGLGSLLKGTYEWMLLNTNYFKYNLGKDNIGNVLTSLCLIVTHFNYTKNCVKNFLLYDNIQHIK